MLDTAKQDVAFLGFEVVRHRQGKLIWRNHCT
jgi:hypothetical protein